MGPCKHGKWGGCHFCPLFDNVIRIVSNVKDMTGKGLEYLVVDGFVIAKFHDGGMMSCRISLNGDRETVTAA